MSVTNGGTLLKTCVVGGGGVWGNGGFSRILERTGRCGQEKNIKVVVGVAVVRREGGEVVDVRIRGKGGKFPVEWIG